METAETGIPGGAKKKKIRNNGRKRRKIPQKIRRASQSGTKNKDVENQNAKMRLLRLLYLLLFACTFGSTKEEAPKAVSLKKKKGSDITWKRQKQAFLVEQKKKKSGTTAEKEGKSPKR
mmetsp:Transcript_7185/g.12700  ORF Transcript_7185/g.12700 Transcript_7185/m.12700 type:complete len:119 (-) Transcript_7185:17-373(-)